MRLQYRFLAAFMLLISAGAGSAQTKDVVEDRGFRTLGSVEEALPADNRTSDEATNLRAIDDVNIINSGECGGFGTFKSVRNSNQDRSIRTTVRMWDNLGNFDNTRSYPVSAGGRTPLPGCTDLGQGQTMSYRIVGAEYQ